jgi:hypothetical protein
MSATHFPEGSTFDFAGTTWAWQCPECLTSVHGFVDEEDAADAAREHNRRWHRPEPDPDLAVDIWKEEHRDSAYLR